MQIKIIFADQVLKRFGNRLGALGSGKAKMVMSRAINHEGRKGYTQVKCVLVKQTGIKYGKIGSAVKNINSTPGNLNFIIEAKGEETSLSLFGAKQGKRGVSAAPWGKRRVFKSTFMRKGHVLRRVGKERYPIELLWGPNIAREIVKDESKAAFEQGSGKIADRIAHEIDRVLMSGR